MMRGIERRLAALESRAKSKLPHVVAWVRGNSFDDALAASPAPPGANDRLLIEWVPVEGGHGQPLVPVEYPGNEGEMAKAHAWATG